MQAFSWRDCGKPRNTSHIISKYLWNFPLNFENYYNSFPVLPIRDSQVIKGKKDNKYDQNVFKIE
jgi:hypothetical protein